MKQMTISMLKPEIGADPGYESFFRNYSMLMSTNIVSHYLIDQASELEIAELLMETVSSAENDYNRTKILHAAIGFSLNSAQIGEERGLDLADISQLIAAGNVTAKEILLTFINCNEFILIFAMFEDTIKRILVEAGSISADAGLREPKIMIEIKKYLENSSALRYFMIQISARTICMNFTDVEAMWRYFVAFRHLYVHSGGRPTPSWLPKFEKAQADLLKRLRKPDLASLGVAETLMSFVPEERRLFMVPDTFANIFRNFVVAIMEALYLSRREIKA
ncbi:hypothetical protein [Sphingobium sp. AP50]|uniref:hypothetical protein n=1 Tax=Sphingobium sp. AP50 TaxID=1884369 RepID=UPI00116012A0|nr:hypothetical protein [Sphingobium sp. AP50]